MVHLICSYLLKSKTEIADYPLSYNQKALSTGLTLTYSRYAEFCC